MAKPKMEYRTVGFTYSSGGREVGWKGEFFKTFEEAQNAGCGDNGHALRREVWLYVDRGFIAAKLDLDGTISDKWSV